MFTLVNEGLELSNAYSVNKSYKTLLDILYNINEKIKLCLINIEEHLNVLNESSVDFSEIIKDFETLVYSIRMYDSTVDRLFKEFIDFTAKYKNTKSMIDISRYLDDRQIELNKFRECNDTLRESVNISAINLRQRINTLEVKKIEQEKLNYIIKRFAFNEPSNIATYFDFFECCWHDVNDNFSKIWIKNDRLSLSLSKFTNDLRNMIAKIKK